MLEAGTLIEGYRVDRALARGAMATVYLATHISLGRSVALKVLAGGAADERARTWFRQEATLVAALEHPHVIPVYEAGETYEGLYIVMMLATGGSLADRVHQGDLTVRETLGILGGVASALDAAHSRGFIHRDVKPSNVLLSATGHAYLADFGVASAAAGTGLDSKLIGTPAYASPEQIQGGMVGPQADVYSLAVVLYECLSGRQPFWRPDLNQVLWAHQFERPPSLPSMNPVVGLLEPVIASGMAKHPSDRPDSATGFIEACWSALAGSPGEMLDLPPVPQAAVPGEPPPHQWATTQVD